MFRRNQSFNHGRTWASSVGTNGLRDHHFISVESNRHREGETFQSTGAPKIVEGYKGYPVNTALLASHGTISRLHKSIDPPTHFHRSRIVGLENQSKVIPTIVASSANTASDNFIVVASDNNVMAVIVLTRMLWLELLSSPRFRSSCSKRMHAPASATMQAGTSVIVPTTCARLSNTLPV